MTGNTAIGAMGNFSNALSGKGGRVLAALALAVILPLAWLKPIDTQAEEYVQKGLKQAFITFGVARVANGVISLIQESSVSVTVSMGVGGSAQIALGQVLDPVNDLVEDFSNLMLAACISFLIQAALLEIGKSPALSGVLTLILLAWAVVRWRNGVSPMWLAKCLVILLAARFAVPLAALGSEMTYQALLGAKHQSAQASLGAATNALESQATQLQATSWRDYLDPKVWREFVQKTKAKAEAWVENSIRVMAVFVVQTVILPLLFLWLVVWLIREFFGQQARGHPT